LTVLDRVSSASTLLGLLLVLVTLFTSEQARSLEVEQHRAGGAQAGSYKRIALTTSGLALVTLASLISLSSLAWDILRLCCGQDWDPALAVFLLVWLLLIPLAVWQVSVARRAWKLRKPSGV
jgi:O-antigen/teichoic acid export membrane protein